MLDRELSSQNQIVSKLCSFKKSLVMQQENRMKKKLKPKENNGLD